MNKNAKGTKRRGSLVCYIFLWLNTGARGEYLTSQVDDEPHVFALST